MFKRLATEEERIAFYRRHRRLPEASWASVFQHMDRGERILFRSSIRSYRLEPEHQRLAPQWLIALDTLDSLDVPDDPKPTAAVRRATSAVLQRMRA